jgi:hypothetical protein
LSDWLKNGWLRAHPPNRNEIAGKLAVVERDLRFSGDPNGDPDWRFVAAFNAALQSATVALLASGYDLPKGSGSHQRMIETLKFTIAADSALVDELQAFRASEAERFMKRSASPVNRKSENSKGIRTYLIYMSVSPLNLPVGTMRVVKGEKCDEA